MAKHKLPAVSVEFCTWLENVSEQFKRFSDEEKNDTLDHLIEVSGPAQLYHLSQELDSLLYRDFLLLPPEVRDYLLSFLDGESLLTCCMVSHFWNNTISNLPRLWQATCRRSGLAIDDGIDNCDQNYWKKLYLDMARRRHQMKTAEAFHRENFDKTLRRVTAVFYYDGMVAAASDSKTIKVWDCSTGLCLLNVRADLSISTLKFDEHILIAASYLGYMASYDIPSGNKITHYERHAGAIFALDFSQDLNIVVSGATDKMIKIWVLSEGQLYKTIRGHTEWVLNLILSPYPSERCESIDNQEHLMISMDNTCISVRLISFVSIKNRPRGLYLTSLYNIPVNNTGNLATYSSGLHFDGTYLHYVKHLDTFCQWDVRNGRMAREINLKHKVKSLLASGDKYIALLLQVDKTEPNFVVLDKESLEAATEWFLPRNRSSSPNCSHFAFGDSSWLNGLDGKNDKGVILTMGTEDKSVCVFRWLPRPTNAINMSYFT